MTKKRYDSHSTEFGLWLREQPELDSNLGYFATNLDFVWLNWKWGNKWCLIEEKRFGGKLTKGQSITFRNLDRLCVADPNYYGFHLITFCKTSPEDGCIILNGKSITQSALIKFLKFEFPRQIYLDVSYFHEHQ